MTGTYVAFGLAARLIEDGVVVASIGAALLIVAAAAAMLLLRP